MMRNTNTSMLSLSLGLFFTNLSITYRRQNSSYKRARVLNIQKGRGVYNLWEDQKEAETEKPTGFKLPTDLIIQILKNWQKWLWIILKKLILILQSRFFGT